MMWLYPVRTGQLLLHIFCKHELDLLSPVGLHAKSAAPWAGDLSSLRLKCLSRQPSSLQKCCIFTKQLQFQLPWSEFYLQLCLPAVSHCLICPQLESSSIQWLKQRMSSFSRSVKLQLLKLWEIFLDSWYRWIRNSTCTNCQVVDEWCLAGARFLRGHISWSVIVKCKCYSWLEGL